MYEYGTISNKPIFKGRLIIEKVDGTGEFLNGVEFKLTRIRESGDPQFDPIIKRTKKNENLLFENLPKGKYILEETSSINHLSPLGVIKLEGEDKNYSFEIKYPDQVIRKI